MADTAHRLTDEKLEEMEKRLSAIYSRAEKTVQKKMADMKANTNDSWKEKYDNLKGEFDKYKNDVQAKETHAAAEQL